MLTYNNICGLGRQSSQTVVAIEKRVTQLQMIFDIIDQDRVGSIPEGDMTSDSIATAKSATQGM